jgi:hypothetical protein
MFHVKQSANGSDRRERTILIPKEAIDEAAPRPGNLADNGNRHRRR